MTEWFGMLAPLGGGVLIGLSAVWVLASQGRVAGVSGMCGAALRLGGDGQGWRTAFLLGLLGVGLVLGRLSPASFGTAPLPALPQLLVAGLLVGFGTRLGNGCTSGHGVCGVSRLSPRSIAATLTFMSTGAISVYVVRHLLAGGG